MGKQAKPVADAELKLGAGGLPDPLKLDLSAVVSMIAGGHPTPPWLADFLADSVCTLAINRSVTASAPSRTELKTKLDDVCNAAKVLTRALQDDDLQLLLDASQLIDAAACERFRRQLRLLVEQAEKQTAALLGSNGKVRAGAGHAFAKLTFSPEVECAVLIAESWRHVSGVYPAPRHEKAHMAADLLWVLSGGERRRGADDPLGTWRQYFQRAVRNSAPSSLGAFRSEVRRRLADAKSLYASLTEGNPGENDAI